jgi:hypothetical protein
MSRVWLARTWARSNGTSRGAGRWVSLPSPPTSPLIPRGVLAPIPEAVGVVLSEASRRGFIRGHLPEGRKDYYYAYAIIFLKHVILFSTPVHYKHNNHHRLHYA